MNINLSSYREKVMGCFLGKNIGGTFGAPFEGEQRMNAATFYTDIIPGEPQPNDDLDLQLVWLLAAEAEHVDRLTPRMLGEYWMKFISGPWNEYGVCRANIGNGFAPPLSGAVNNEKWKWSNGAWIRSEIWACIAPGNPDEAIRLAWMDACCDHCGEGIYAELFTAALESAAFLVDDSRHLLEIALARVPADSRVAAAVRTVIESYDAGLDFKAARAAVLENTADLGWFQAPANLGYVVIGLLYGGGDFEKSLIYTVNCGDDTDCTGATVGAILGIQYGAAKIPQKWIEPIGTGLRTIAVNAVDLMAPKNLEELTRRIENVALDAVRENPLRFHPISPAPDHLGPDELPVPDDAAARKLWAQSPYELAFELPWGEVAIDYENGPAVTPGEPKKLTVRFRRIMPLSGGVDCRFLLPEGWLVTPGPDFSLLLKSRTMSWVELELMPGEFTDGALVYVPLRIRLQERNEPLLLNVPFQRRGAVDYGKMVRNLSYAGEEPLYQWWSDRKKHLTAKQRRQH